jgi:hypothetical protein
MKRISRARNTLRALVLAAIVGAGWSLCEGRAWADVCFSGPHESTDAGGRDAGDGATLGLRGPAGTRRTVGAGLLLVAGLGGAWLGARRKRDAEADSDGDAPIK